jgi:hypothetical protein
MNREERPIVFTIRYSEVTDSYFIRSEDNRAEGLVTNMVHRIDLFFAMVKISEILNNKGYAVLFEVD